MPAFSGKDGYAFVTNERIRISPVDPVLYHIRVIDRLNISTEYPGDRRSAVFPDTLRNKGILLMDGALAMCR